MFPRILMEDASHFFHVSLLVFYPGCGAIFLLEGFQKFSNSLFFRFAGPNSKYPQGVLSIRFNR